MSQNKLLTFSKGFLIVAGIASLVYAFYGICVNSLTWGYASILLLSVTIVPRLSLPLPRSKFAISFSDALIFLTFLVYGGPAAIFLAAAETLANCTYLSRRGFPLGKLMIPVNVSLNVLATTFTYGIWHLMPGSITQLSGTAQTQSLITVLGILATTHFLGSSILAAVFQSIKEGTNPYRLWRKDCFSSSMTQIVGAGLAGMIFKLLNYGDPITAVLAALVVSVAYVTYRQSIAEINTAISQVEEAERQKAETERERRREAEAHASQLAESLEKQEKANAALRQSRRDFKHAALHDSLTGLANRKHLVDMLRSMINDYRNDPLTSFYVLYLDISRFKNINDSLGHIIGDNVLMIAAKRFVRMLTPADTVARLGGDEFAIILRNLSTVGKAQKVARKIAANIALPFSLSGNRISIGVNIGIAPCDVEYRQPEDILRDADIAMHYAKQTESGVAVFTKQLRDRFLERAALEMDLRHAVERNELLLNYQPIVSLTEGQLIGFEALVRWKHPDRGLIPPGKFIPIAEETGQIQAITVWILDKACQSLAKWRSTISDARDLMVSVNISGKHLSTDQLLEDVDLALETAGLPPRALKLEITESTAMANPDHTVKVLTDLKKLGVQLSIDDFGTGYSSFSQLHRLPFDTLKIDRSFVASVGENGENSEILRTIISLAKNLKMRVIAEGIENEIQLGVLRGLGCDYGQGFLFSKPLAPEAAQSVIESSKDLVRGAVSCVNEIDAALIDSNLPVF